MLGRMLPWLWRLGDEENTRFVVPAAMQAELVAALQGVEPHVADAQVRACGWQVIGGERPLAGSTRRAWRPALNSMPWAGAVAATGSP